MSRRMLLALALLAVTAASAAEPAADVQVFTEPGVWENPWPGQRTELEIILKGEAGTEVFKWDGELLPYEVPVAPGRFGDIVALPGHGYSTTVVTHLVYR